MRIPYNDISDFAEDDRIRQIGEKTMNEKLVVGFFVDTEGADGYAKADRYIAKLEARFPGIRVTYKGPGLVADTVAVKVEPPLN